MTRNQRRKVAANRDHRVQESDTRRHRSRSAADAAPSPVAQEPGPAFPPDTPRVEIVPNRSAEEEQARRPDHADPPDAPAVGHTPDQGIEGLAQRPSIRSSCSSRASHHTMVSSNYQQSCVEVDWEYEEARIDEEEANEKLKLIEKQFQIIDMKHQSRRRQVQTRRNKTPADELPVGETYSTNSQHVKEWLDDASRASSRINDDRAVITGNESNASNHIGKPDKSYERPYERPPSVVHVDKDEMSPESGHNIPHTRKESEASMLAEVLKNLARPIPRQAFELPHFDGDPGDWVAFKHTYYETNKACQFKPYENMGRLRSTLRGAARNAVEIKLKTSTDPEEIMRLLDEEFGDPNLLLHCALRKVKNLPKLTGEGRELKAFATAVRNCVGLLKDVRSDGYLNNPQLFQELRRKLTLEQQSKFGNYARKLDDRPGVDMRASRSVEILSQFLDEIAREAAYYVDMEEPAKSSTAYRAPEPKRKSKNVGRVQQVHVNSAVQRKCELCDGNHRLSECENYKKLNVAERWYTVKKYRKCYKCVDNNHHTSKCTRAKPCAECGARHHISLHDPEYAGRASVERVTNLGQTRTTSLLKILPVTIKSVNGHDRYVSCYALLDDGATVSLVDNSMTGKVTGPRIPLFIEGARGHKMCDLNSRSVIMEVQGPNGLSHKVECRTISDLNLPSQTISKALLDKCAHLRNLGCEEMDGAKPLLLLGQDNWELIVGRELREGKSGKPIASLTKLGWVVHGRIGDKCRSTHRNESVNCMALQELVKQQFELEAIGITESTRKHHEIERAEIILETTGKRTPIGTQWEVGLLWKGDNVNMPDNYTYARKRLEGVEKKMKRDSAYAAAYTGQINRLINEGYAQRVDSDFDARPVWYLPHFGVTNPNKPGKLRLVFDAAAPFQGTSLNDNLLSGPDLLNSLLGVLFKFRVAPIGFAGDIADMFLQIRIRQEDRGAQRFLWRSEESAEPEVYVMNTVIFGAVSSPASAIHILNKNAEEFRDSFPEAADAILKNHYMDDYLHGAWTVDQASKLIDDVTKIHAAGGFSIRGWVTNSPELREKLQLQMPERVALDKGDDAKERTLGMIWSPAIDSLAFDLSFKKLPNEIVNGAVVPTKREFLRFIMSIFDPLGFLYPCIIQSRILMRDIWKSGIEWDERLQEPEARKWFTWMGQLHTLREVSIPRWYGSQPGELELHVFGDASDLAYAAVAYIVGTDAKGNKNVAMVIGKARVAPQKVTSIPRLELQAAVLACRLACVVKQELGLPIAETFLWTDSMTVLKWINSDAHEFQRFVSHRLSEIDRHSNRSNWRWVPSAQNPADKATRFDWPNNSKEWLSGPSFLRYPQNQWPTCELIDAPEDTLERVQRVHTVASSAPPLAVYGQASTWSRALRVTARVLIFIDRCKKRRTSAQLHVDDLRRAENHLLLSAQAESFPTDLQALRSGQPLPTSSKLRKLDPMLYDDGLLRVRGRLRSCDEMTFDEKHPIILDGHHPLVRMLIHQYHVAALHANQETVVNNVREKYWVTNLRATVKAVTSNCQICRIRRATPTVPKMGDLPTARTEVTKRAFVHCGVDYFGPMEVSIGRRREKRWGVLFTCLATRAVHLELASSLSADSAILALRRLISRRGRPNHLYSDRGTNFVGAHAELRAALRGLDHDLVKEDAINRGIEWHFNPPAAPHMGGCWERLVRSVKNALKITLKEQAPREEVLYTLLTEAELVINSRPLAYVAADGEHPVVLTPNHLLLGTASGDTPFTNGDAADINLRRQWRKVNALANVFWRRWLREYLPTLQQRQKWLKNVPNLKIGDVVVIVDNNKQRNEWDKGVIVATHEGPDSIVRVVDVKTTHGVLRRPVAKVAALPTSD